MALVTGGAAPSRRSSPSDPLRGVGLWRSLIGRSALVIAMAGVCFAVTLVRSVPEARADSNHYPAVSMASTLDGSGYWILDSQGNVFSFGAPYLGGSPTGFTGRFVSIAAGPHGGYWLLDSTGQVYSYGEPYRGGSPTRYSGTFVGMAVGRHGGYWLLDSAGQVYAYGERYRGGSAAGYSGRFTSIVRGPHGGYWLLDSAGQVYSYGERYRGGSPTGYTGQFTGMVTGSHGGYWLLDTAGQIYSYGNEPYHGGSPPESSRWFVGVASGPSRSGYRLVDSMGHVYAYGSATYLGGFVLGPLDATYDRALGQGMADSFRGWTDAEWTCLDQLWTRESGWKWDIWNAQGSSAYGIPQALPYTKMAAQADGGADSMTNPVTQIRWGLGYIARSYGTPCTAWAHSQQTGWY
jgi:hypothetical protein